MALIREFYRQGDGEQEGESYALARDILTERVFVLRCETRRVGSVLRDDETQLPLAEFLLQTGAAQTELLDLIGTLVVEE